MVDRAEDYPWSSAAAHVSGNSANSQQDLLDWGIWHRLGRASGWRHMLAGADPDALVNLLRRCTYAERPFGDEPFIRQMETTSGRNWSRYPYQAELKSAGLALSLDALRSVVDEPWHGSRAFQSP